ncbi:hypothetical protein SAMN05216480_11665 [Pustulibacterium marinum]|uniref:Uncharacterized protein n=1 Tax=Pustulibacterium marinum TaxID=1224947 RepID=A0A1I7IHU8_9FLAO|nr:hypothetical protein [Pustulibacterium marinum]SFU72493.1 hypothetical protein SAMN05216480_11665 [Pustulibacterium marinum]
MKNIIFCLVIFMFANEVLGQESAAKKENQIFPERCLGTWKGTMMIYFRGELKDSVTVEFTAAKISKPNEYIWKTDYISAIKPITKDYKLLIDPENKHEFIIDEGDGVQLKTYVFANKMYSLFEVDGIYLTSTTEIVRDSLIFEVTSGKKHTSTEGVQNFSFDVLQRVVLQRME